jgi:hypothetical protein
MARFHYDLLASTRGGSEFADANRRRAGNNVRT